MRRSPDGTPNEEHCELLRFVYQDFERLADTATDDIILHTADRALVPDGIRRGLATVLAHERGLLEATAGTLVMDVRQVIADDHFGAVMGILRATKPARIAMPFCGLWRFAEGKLAEHWENAYAASELGGLF
ncbi:nuclear transport factor 2 family protein [Amycolatopsis sp. NPDC059090]|uniref:nuclear transport factor 2 family protein n=1 Tax=unclassified Amycolatopsis TaxID=2618356 RepID=UPI00366C0A74